MSGAGHMMELNRRMREFRADKKRRSFHKLKKKYVAEAKRQHVDIRRATPEEMADIRKKIKTIKRKRLKKEILALLFCLMVALFVWSKIHSKFDAPYQYPPWSNSDAPDQEIIDYYKDYNIEDEKAKLKAEYESLIQTPI